MSWFRKELAFHGSVWFRGTLPPRPDDFAALDKLGVRCSEPTHPQDAHWSMEMTHDHWGAASLLSPRDCLPPPHVMLDYDPGLTEEERNNAAAAGTGVLVRVPAEGNNVVRDRKRALCYLKALLGSDGVIACDHTAQKAWSPSALADECSHNADVDVCALFSVHAVQGEHTEVVTWLHTHGLADLGAHDFDILHPSPDLITGRCEDGLRCIAYLIVEGRVGRSEPRVVIAHPGGCVSFVDVGDFTRRAAQNLQVLRDNDDDHNQNRCVICQPRRRLFGRWFGALKNSSFLSNGIEDGVVFPFSIEATELMAQRARETYDVLRTFRDEFDEFELPCLTKIGLAVDGGEPDEREHLWFTVNELLNQDIDGELVNRPHGIARLEVGNRDRYPIDLMSDWVILTPLGPINPRNFRVARAIREHADELRQHLKSCGTDS